MLCKAGERVPLACKRALLLSGQLIYNLTFARVPVDRYCKMLHDTLVNMCGQQFADSIPDTLPPRGYYMALQASRPMVGNIPHTVEHIVLS